MAPASPPETSQDAAAAATLYVARVPKRATNAELASAFEAKVPGRVVSAEIRRTTLVPGNQGFGVVQFKDDETLERCIDQIVFRVGGRMVSAQRWFDVTRGAHISGITGDTTTEALEAAFERTFPDGIRSVTVPRGIPVSRRYGVVVLADTAACETMKAAGNVILNDKCLPVLTDVP